MLMLSFIIAAAASPASDKPSVALVKQIEGKLSRDRCVRPLARWWRHYAYWHEGRTDTRYVNVWFVEAGHNGIRSGRVITEPQPPLLDDSQFRLVSGKYEISTGRFVRLFCGLNHPGKPAGWNVL